MYNYKISPLKIIDGDTIDAEIDLGFDIKVKKRVRFAGIIFGRKIDKQLGIFAEGKYNKYWNREWYDFKFGINYIIR